ncbi:MAG: hypothetical protein ABIY70_04285 [Capsulimonas sp.]|uniref:hypothetical protein n=1 Tax=Capsulimonas sp. TaxID=2494211 RepID=UPI003265E704
MNNRTVITAALALGGSAGFLMGSGALRTQAQPPVTPAISLADASESARIATLEKRVKALETRLNKVAVFVSPSGRNPLATSNEYRAAPPPAPEWRVVPLDKTNADR